MIYTTSTYVDLEKSLGKFTESDLALKQMKLELVKQHKKIL